MSMLVKREINKGERRDFRWPLEMCVECRIRVCSEGKIHRREQTNMKKVAKEKGGFFIINTEHYVFTYRLSFKKNIYQ